MAAEPHVLQIVHARQIRRSGFDGPLFVASGSSGGKGGWTVARDNQGQCAFFDHARGRLCAIHAAAGPDALPAACRHFPRTILRDDRGTHISLSHFCPTAAALLFKPDPLRVVEAGAPLRPSEPVEGLDAGGALPPLLRPDALTDLEGYSAWEAACLVMFARADLPHAQAIALIADATERVRIWQPGTATLKSAVECAFADARSDVPADPLAHERTMEIVRSVSSIVVHRDIQPIDGFEDEWLCRVEPSAATFERAMKNYLAARLFGNWIAYQGRGLRSVVQWLRTCAALVRHFLLQQALTGQRTPGVAEMVEAFRKSDLLLLHVIDSQAFARRVHAIEGGRRG